MTQSALCVTEEEFNLFHWIDRRLYTILVINLWRDPLESMKIIAFWLWLERSGFNNAVTKMLSLPYILVNELADEAVTCLNSMNGDHYSCSDSHDIPLIQSLMEKEVDLHFFHRNRISAVHGISRIVKEVCLRGMKDIMDMALERNQMAAPQPIMVNGGGESEVVPADDRTMFVTFSKGYPVYEWEVREFFGKGFGECIESLYMQEVEGDEQSLFARIVFHSASTIEKVLNGEGKAKFTINSKHVWARKFVPKRPKPLSSSSSPYEMPPLPPYFPFTVS